MKGYIDWQQKEAIVVENGEWIDRFSLDTTTNIGSVYRMRIKKPVPALEGFILEGPNDQDYLLFEKNTRHPRKSGDVVLVEIFRTAYDDKMPMVTEYLSLQTNDPLWDKLEKQVHFDPVPKELARLKNPVISWLKHYPEITWISNNKKDFETLLNEYDKDNQISWTYDPSYSFDVDPAIASQREYWLSRTIQNEYAQIVVDKTEAATLIDINQAENSPHILKLPKDAKTKTVNLQSIPLIVKAIKLQQLQGIVLIDAIRMPKTEGPTYLQALKDELYKQYVVAKVLGFSRAGFVEVLVKRKDG